MGIESNISQGVQGWLKELARVFLELHINRQVDRVSSDLPMHGTMLLSVGGSVAGLEPIRSKSCSLGKEDPPRVHASARGSVAASLCSIYSELQIVKVNGLGTRHL